MSEIASVAMGHKSETALREDDERPLVERPTNDAPFPWQELIRSVHIWIPVDHAARLRGQYRLLCAGDQIGEAVFLLGLHGRCGLGHRRRQTAGKIDSGGEIAAIGGDAANG